MEVAGLESLAGGRIAEVNQKKRKEIQANVVKQYNEEQRLKKEAELLEAESKKNEDPIKPTEEKEKRSWRKLFSKN